MQKDLQISVHTQGAIMYYTLIRKLYLQKQIYSRLSIVKMNSTINKIIFRPISDQYPPAIFQFQSHILCKYNILLKLIKLHNT